MGKPLSKDTSKLTLVRVRKQKGPMTDYDVNRMEVLSHFLEQPAQGIVLDCVAEIRRLREILKGAK